MSIFILIDITFQANMLSGIAATMDFDTKHFNSTEENLLGEDLTVTLPISR